MTKEITMDNNSPPWADDWTGQQQVVQVRIPGARRSYAYTWDGEPLEVGDWVLLPGNEVSPGGTEGRVDGFGSDGYKGPMKAIVSKQEKQDPWIARMRQVRTPADRLQVYRRAQKAGISGERLQKLVELGKQVLGQRARADRLVEQRREDADVAARVKANARFTEDYDRQGESVDAPAAVAPTGSLGRVDAGASSQEQNSGWGEWE